MTCYACDKCKAVDSKLWRPAASSNVQLICWRCLEVSGHEITYGQHRGSDQVYDSKVESTSWVPAIPDLEGGWWTYTSVPEWWVAWWKALPNRRDDCTMCGGSKRVAEFTCFKCLGTGVRDSLSKIDDPNESETISPAEALQAIRLASIGRSLRDVRANADAHGWIVRVTREDGTNYISTCDVRNNRINVSVENGVVVAVTGIG